MKILLDTNAYSFYTKGNKFISTAVENSIQIYLSAVTIGELYFGFLHGNRPQLNEKILNEFLNNWYVNISGISKKTAKIYGGIANIMHKKGTPVPTNDIWIAACAIETGSTLVTYDSHFLKIPNLKLWKELKKG